MKRPVGVASLTLRGRPLPSEPKAPSCTQVAGTVSLTLIVGVWSLTWAGLSSSWYSSCSFRLQGPHCSCSASAHLALASEGPPSLHLRPSPAFRANPPALQGRASFLSPQIRSHWKWGAVPPATDAVRGGQTFLQLQDGAGAP